jgi:predicted nucleic acid-binding protein
MCVVIDANTAADFCRQEKPYLRELLRWINKGGRVAAGGKLEQELYKVEPMRALLIEWSRSGRLIKVSKEKIEACERRIKKGCRSNDTHVIALAITSKAEIVVTADKELISDLKNTQVVQRVLIVIGHCCKVQIVLKGDRFGRRLDH